MNGDFYFNEHSTDLAHIVPCITGFDAGEDVATCCGLVTTVADRATEYPLCAECVRTDEEANQ